jgi:hypothetical protein
LQEGYVDGFDGAAGVLYKKHFFDEMWLEFYEDSPKECISADDV